MTLSDRRLDARLSALPRQAPVPDMWPEIRRRIRRRRVITPGIAAAALLLAAVTGWLMIGMRPDPNAPDSPEARIFTAEGAAMRELTAGPAWIQAMDADGDWRTAWETNREAIAELESALESNPDHRLLLDLLARAHLRQAALLRRVPATELPKPSMRL